LRVVPSSTARGQITTENVVTSDTNVTIDDPNADDGTRPSEAPFLGARAPYPEGILVDWTSYCNAQCFFCPRDIGPMVGEFVPLAKLTKLERVLSSVKYFSISSSIGEPLLHPELQQILQWLYRINPKILLRVTTGKGGMVRGSSRLALRVAEREQRGSAYARHVPAPRQAGH
jgi:hypothetical protein